MKKLARVIVALIGIPLSACAGPGESGWYFPEPIACNSSQIVVASGSSVHLGPRIAENPTGTPLGFLGSLLGAKQAPIEEFKSEVSQVTTTRRSVDHNNHKVVNVLGPDQSYRSYYEIKACEERKRLGQQALRAQGNIIR